MSKPEYAVIITALLVGYIVFIFLVIRFAQLGMLHWPW